MLALGLCGEPARSSRMLVSLPLQPELELFQELSLPGQV